MNYMSKWITNNYKFGGFYMRKSAITICLFVFSVIFSFTACNNTQKNNSPNNEITISKISSKIINDEYLIKMDEYGVYLLESEKNIIVAFNLEDDTFDTNVRVNNSNIEVSYSCGDNVNNPSKIDYCYCIENCDENTNIRLYKDNKETSFEKVITADTSILS